MRSVAVSSGVAKKSRGGSTAVRFVLFGGIVFCFMLSMMFLQRPKNEAPALNQLRKNYVSFPVTSGDGLTAKDITDKLRNDKVGFNPAETKVRKMPPDMFKDTAVTNRIGQAIEHAAQNNNNVPMVPTNSDGGSGGSSSGSRSRSETTGGGLGSDTVLLIMASNRPEYLTRTLNFVVKYHQAPHSLPIVISEDGKSAQVANVVQAAQVKLAAARPNAHIPFIHMHHDTHGQRFENGYFKLADHFKWALDKVFLESSTIIGASTPVVKRVIILEEDLEIAPDFFEFFASTASMLDTDNTLLAVSAWNDNGMVGMVKDSKQLYRSDFFPGLGWMMNAEMWGELGPKWPKAYWDDWLREPAQRKGRQIIRPEVCRSLHFGSHGVSNAQYSEFLTTIKLNEQYVPFTTMDLSYLQQEHWDRNYIAQVRAATPIDSQSAVKRVAQQAVGSTEEYRLSYTSFEGRGSNTFSTLCKWTGAMDNVKANVPRTAYKGIVTVWVGNAKIHIVPSDAFQ